MNQGIEERNIQMLAKLHDNQRATVHTRPKHTISRQAVNHAERPNTLLLKTWNSDNSRVRDAEHIRGANLSDFRFAESILSHQRLT